MPRPTFPVPPQLYGNNSTQTLKYPHDQNAVERPQNLIMMTSPSRSSHQEIPERGSVVTATVNKVNNNCSHTSSPAIFEPVAGPSGLQRQNSIVSTQNIIDSDSSDLEDDAEVAAMNLQKPRVIYQQPYRNITRTNLRHFMDSDDSSECNQPPPKRAVSQATNESISDATDDDDVIFVSSTKEPAASIDLTMDDEDDSNEVVSVTTATQTSNDQRRENVLRINNQANSMWETSSSNDASHPHIMTRDSCTGFSLRVNNNEANTSEPSAIVLNTNTQASINSSREQFAPPDVMIEFENDTNTPVYNIGSAPNEGGNTTNLRFNYNIPSRRPSHCPYMETYRNRYSPLRLINTLSNSPQSTQTEVTRLSMSPMPSVAATPSPTRQIISVSPPNIVSQPLHPHPVGPGPAHQPPPPLAHSIGCNSRRVHCSHYIPPPATANLNRCTQIYPPVSVHPGMVIPNHHFYQPHHDLWHRQQNQQELHRRHNAPTPIDLSSARRSAYRSSCTCHCTSAHSHHHHRPLPSTGAISGAVRNLDSVSSN